MNRPSWDEYYMDMAFLIAQKSLDPDTKHGCIVVDSENTPLSMGFNGPARGCTDENVPLTRPLKYKWMIHSELNAIINAARSGVSLKGSTFYITGFPCVECFRSILNVGAIRIIYGPVNSNCISEEDKKTVELMNQKVTDHGAFVEHLRGVVGKKFGSRIILSEYKLGVGKILAQAQDYIKQKCKFEV